MNTFRYVEPASVTEVVSVLKNDVNTSIMGGGSDLLSEIKNGTTQPNVLVGLSRISDLKGITATDTDVRIGSMVTISEISSAKFLQLPQPEFINSKKLKIDLISDQNNHPAHRFT